MPKSEVLQTFTLGTIGGLQVKAVQVVSQPSFPEGMSVRSALLQDDGSHGFLFHQAASLMNWGANFKFCPRCQAHLVITDNIHDRGRSCSQCSYRGYPTVSPCVITLIHRGDHVLLARGLNHPPGFHSLIAGFVEPGETLEQAVAREIMEETGLEVDNIVYQHSQPWPMPHNLMMGFHARYKSGDINIDTQELAHAQWYPLADLPALPPPQTIAWQLIDKYRKNFQP
ncbi:NAD(+) diphosphatase [Sansalvadorimonas verongulae]|uniref:NAD(+) diphosphatase n=1 Tax=Sansalvadorimonas verongulae TaxID=2172824 RepID=UPI001E516007|nr:NAD(+) diphosphatase [Sansalvadorimonas verongulae]